MHYENLNTKIRIYSSIIIFISIFLPFSLDTCSLESDSIPAPVPAPAPITTIVSNSESIEKDSIDKNIKSDDELNSDVTLEKNRFGIKYKGELVNQKYINMFPFILIWPIGFLILESIYLKKFKNIVIVVHMLLILITLYSIIVNMLVVEYLLGGIIYIFVIAIQYISVFIEIIVIVSKKIEVQKKIEKCSIKNKKIVKIGYYSSVMLITLLMQILALALISLIL